MLRKVIIVLTFLMFSTATLNAQDAKPKINPVPATYTSPASGPEMYQNYCAACHGKNGSGDGPAAPALRAVPTDLTTLARKNGGKFPTAHFSSVLTGKATVAAHGSQEMPVWGKVFWKLSEGHQPEVQQRVSNLEQFVESLQKK